MTFQEMLARLALRIEDPEKRVSDAYKRDALNNAQLLVPQLLDGSYLTELEVEDGNTATSSGVVALSGLDQSVFKGTEGIIRVKDYTGYECIELTLSDLKREENFLYDAKKQNPLYYVFANAIRCLPTTLTAVDVLYQRNPAIFEHNFTVTESGTPAVDQFAIDDNQGVNETDDYYNNSIVWCGEKSSYHKVGDYTGATREITLLPSPADGNLGTSTMYFATGDHGLCNVANITCILNAALHELVINFAEVECWSNLKNHGRSMEALKKALKTVQSLNELKERKIQDDKVRVEI